MAVPRLRPSSRIILGLVAILGVLTIATLNLQRYGMVVLGGACAATLRTINAAEATYAAAYPHFGYAPTLFVLGAGGSQRCDRTHACLLDKVLACPESEGLGWCIKGRYRYNIQSSSKKAPYKDYWVTATPVEADAKLRNYCSGSDSVIRSKAAKPLKVPYTLAECLALPVDSSYPD